MKKWLLLVFLFTQICLSANADGGMPIHSQINNSIFSPEGSRPLMNLERTKFQNQAIMNIETKYSYKEQQNSEIEDQNTSEIEKPKGIKSWFKGFVCEW